MSFLENLSWRYATKNFDGSIVSDENLQKILSAIQMAPSSSGLQPYHILVISNKEKLEYLKQFTTNKKKFETCSHMFVFCSRNDLMKRQAELVKIKSENKAEMFSLLTGWRNSLAVAVGNVTKSESEASSWTKAQTYLALGFALAACAELKIDSCPMEGFDADSLKKELELDNSFEVVALMAIGNRAEYDKIYPKTRFPKEDLFTFI